MEACKGGDSLSFERLHVRQPVPIPSLGWGSAKEYLKKGYSYVAREVDERYQQKRFVMFLVPDTHEAPADHQSAVPEAQD